jgi:hypothetical protein
VTGSFDWLNTSPEAFLERYAPAAAAKSRAAYGTPRPPSTPTATPNAALPGPGLGIAGSGQARQPYQPKFHSQEDYNMTQFDFAHLPPQIDRRIAIQTMMQTSSQHS